MRCLATPTEYQTIAHLFGIANSPVCKIIHETCQCVVNVLIKDYIKFPHADRLDHVVDEFKIKWRVHNVLVQLMDVMHQYLLQAICILITTTVRGGTLC